MVFDCSKKEIRCSDIFTIIAEWYNPKSKKNLSKKISLFGDNSSTPSMVVHRRGETARNLKQYDIWLGGKSTSLCRANHKVVTKFSSYEKEVLIRLALANQVKYHAEFSVSSELKFEDHDLMNHYYNGWKIYLREDLEKFQEINSSSHTWEEFIGNIYDLIYTPILDASYQHSVAPYSLAIYWDHFVKQSYDYQMKRKKINHKFTDVLISSRISRQLFGVGVGEEQALESILDKISWVDFLP